MFLHSLTHLDTHRFYSFEIRPLYKKVQAALKNLILPEPSNDCVIGLNDSHKTYVYKLENKVKLPKRAEVEANKDKGAKDMDKLLAMLVKHAVKQVGWVPRDVFQYMETVVEARMFFQSYLMGSISTNEFLQGQRAQRIVSKRALVRWRRLQGFFSICSISRLAKKPKSPIEFSCNMLSHSHRMTSGVENSSFVSDLILQRIYSLMT